MRHAFVTICPSVFFTWQGITGQVPTVEEWVEALAGHDLFVYCGHGTGQSLYPINWTHWVYYSGCIIVGKSYRHMQCRTQCSMRVGVSCGLSFGAIFGGEQWSIMDNAMGVEVGSIHQYQPGPTFLFSLSRVPKLQRGDFFRVPRKWVTSFLFHFQPLP